MTSATTHALKTFSILADLETPLSLFSKICDAEPTAFLLESAADESRLARFSFIGFSPVQTVCFKNGNATIKNVEGSNEVVVDNPLDYLKTEITKYLPPQTIPPKELADVPFFGGWVGYMGYGAIQYFETIPQQANDPLNVPDGYYGLYDAIICFDHYHRRITLMTYRDDTEAKTLWENLLTIFNRPQSLGLLTSSSVAKDDVFDQVTVSQQDTDFSNTIHHIKDRITEGQVFQLVISRRFSTPLDTSPLDVYRHLRAINPSPYTYYLKYPEFVYLGASPETFVTCRQGKVVLRALAGTRPRGKTDEEDLRLEEELVNNEKELAEHRMLVDLGRNDLGKISQTGTVQVGQIARVTRYSHVMHLSTEIQGTLRPDKTAYDAFQCCFPRGTVTGAPKHRAMTLLADLEPEHRGIYSGVVGYFDAQGNMDGAIAIRSALVKDGTAHVQAGAGVVYDSDPQAECDETHNKAKGMLTAIHLAKQGTT
ncbi:MAG: anthranilate synthase component I family protein [Vampirovibrio sp.]|nr:anthranilate synthase component I family protein [Vampirovibrio sp.]